MSSELQERRFWDGYSALVKKAWNDEAFKRRLLADPTAVFKENDLPVPEGMQLRILEDKENLRHLPLPAKPTLQETPRGRETVTAGSWFCCHTWSDQETKQG
jgi:hypothetical protein